MTKEFVLAVIFLVALLVVWGVALSNQANNLPELPPWEDPTMNLDIDDPYN